MKTDKLKWILIAGLLLVGCRGLARSSEDKFDQVRKIITKPFLYKGGAQTGDVLRTVQIQIDGAMPSEELMKKLGEDLKEFYKPSTQFDIEFWRLGSNGQDELIAIWQSFPDGRRGFYRLKK